MRASSAEPDNSAQLNGHHAPNGHHGANGRHAPGAHGNHGHLSGHGHQEASSGGILRRGAGRAAQPPGPRYKWIALSNTTLGVLMATINASIMLIALPDIFRGIGVNPLQPGNTSLLLWMIMGYLVVTAVLVVSFGRLGDMFGRVRIYNLGFAVFSVFSVLLALTWLHGSAAAWWIIAGRILQGVGGAMLLANSSALLTDAFPANQRGLALGLNQVAAIAGSFIGLVLGGLLGPIDWRLVFLVSVPFGVFGTFWAYLKLRELGVRRPARLDWLGNVTFAVGLIAVLVGITYGIQPYGGHTMGWTSPFVLTAIFGGLAVLILFCFVETRVEEPMFQLRLFRIRAFTAGNLASLLSSLGRGGLMFVLIIWLQGIYLPRHGVSFSDTPLKAGIYMLPLTLGFLIAGPVSGWLSDRCGARPFSTDARHGRGRGLVPAPRAAADQLLLPGSSALILLLNGLGVGLFASPNRAGIMNSLPRESRGVGAGIERHLPELGHGAVHRYFLHADHPGPGLIAAGRAPPRPGGAGCVARRRGPGRGPAAGLGHVRGAARLQPDPDAARPRPDQAAGQPRRLPDRAQLLPGADLPLLL